MRLQCEISNVQQLDLRIWQVAPVGLGTGAQEAPIVPGPR